MFKQMSDGMADAVASISPSLVRVEGRRRSAASGVVMSADGVIVTANHVVTRDEEIRIGTHDGTILEAALIGRDPSTGIAVLKANAALPAVSWQDASHARVGELVLAVARPGKTVQATLGVMSAIGSSYQTGAGGTIDHYIQTDVLMYPGFSGGALLNAAGEAYGINSSAIMQGASVTIPTETIRRVVNALMQHGHIKRGYLGVTAQSVRLPEAIANEAGQEMGLLVASVEPGSPAGSAGVLLGDVLLSLDGVPTTSMESLMHALSTERIGTEVTARLVRGGAMHDLPVTIGERA